MQVIELSVDLIIVSSPSIRTRLDAKSLANLSDSINEVGMLQPILVMASGTKYRLVAGERRFKACLRLGRASIHAVVLSGVESERQVQLVENLQREDLNPVDKAMALKTYMDSAGISKTAASRELGIPRTTLNDWLGVLDIDTRFQDALLNNFYDGSSPLTASHVSLAKRFAHKMGSEKLVNTILDSVIYYSLTRAEAKRVIRLVETAKDISIEEAVRKIRLKPNSKVKDDTSQEWDPDKLVNSLARSGDYLVKANAYRLQGLSSEQRYELLRQSKALSKLLEDLLEMVPEADDQSTKIS